MKRTFIYLFSVFLAGIAFTSCLGDTETTTSGSNFAVIQRTDDGTLYAAVGGGLGLTWNGLSSKYNVGDALYMSYTVDLNQYVVPFVADAANIQELEYYPYQNQLRINIGENIADTTASENPYKFEALNIRAFSPNEYHYNDKYLFHVRASLREGQEMRPVFYYDRAEGMQHTSTGGQLPENTIIIDVRLEVSNQGNPGTTNTSREESFVVNLADLRNVLFDNSSTEVKQCVFWLRYYNNESTTRPYYLQSNIGGLYYVPQNK